MTIFRLTPRYDTRLTVEKKARKAVLKKKDLEAKASKSSYRPHDLLESAGFHKFCQVVNRLIPASKIWLRAVSVGSESAFGERVWSGTGGI